MRIVFVMVLLVGVGLAGFAVFMVQGVIEDATAQRDELALAQSQAVRLVDVVVAGKSLKYGERFSRDDLKTIKWPADNLPKGVFTYVVGAADAPSDVRAVFLSGETRPRAALRSYETHEPILEAKITKPGVDAGLTANLTPGLRAFTIGVDSSTGVSGFLRPGDRVDVYWFGQIGGQQMTQLILSGVRLIAIDQNADADRSEETVIARTVTVEVSPEQVAALNQAQSTGRLSLSLVGTGDDTVLGPIVTDTATVLGITQEIIAAPEVNKVCTVKSRKGDGTIEEIEVECRD